MLSKRTNWSDQFEGLQSLSMTRREIVMTNYYYIASDKKLGDGNASLQFLGSEEWSIPGFDYPVQKEIVNGVEKHWELRELLQYIRNNAARYDVCTVQIAHLVNPTELKVQTKSNIYLHDIFEPKQLLLAEGQLLSIIKE